MLPIRERRGGTPYRRKAAGRGGQLLLIKKAIEEEVDFWDYVFNAKWLEEYKGRVGVLEEFVEVTSCAKLYPGIPLEDWSDRAVAKIVGLLKRQKPHLAGHWGPLSTSPASSEGRSI